MTAYFEPQGPRILAHRGLALHATENSLRAFAAAVETGVTHLETDVHATRDGVAVLWHDPTLRRFDDTGTAIGDVTWPELRRRTNDLGDSLTTLGEALAAFPDARFNIDVKHASATGPVSEAVLAGRAQDRVLLTSFRESIARVVWRDVPSAARGATRERIAAALVGAALRSPAIVRRALDGIDAVQIPERAIGLTLTAPHRISSWRQYAHEVHVWTVNDPTDMVRLWRAGIDGIVTDRADLAHAARASIPMHPRSPEQGNTDTASSV